MELQVLFAPLITPLYLLLNNNNREVISFKQENNNNNGTVFIFLFPVDSEYFKRKVLIRNNVTDSEFSQTFSVRT